MSLEQKFFQFDTKTFESDLKNFLEKYWIAADDFDHNIGNQDVDEAEKKELELKMNDSMNQLVSLSVDALKSVNNKQEVLDIMSSVFLHGDVDVDKCLKKIILELLKTQN